jgi:hypothetical protein
MLLHSASVKAVFPEPTGPPIPTRSGPLLFIGFVHERNSLVYWTSCFIDVISAMTHELDTIASGVDSAVTTAL